VRNTLGRSVRLPYALPVSRDAGMDRQEPAGGMAVLYAYE